MTGKRVLAVQLDNELFDSLDEFVEQEGITKQKYISDLLKTDLALKQEQRQQQELEIRQQDGQNVWNREDVLEAIDGFMARNERIPKQTEFKNENGLPSYGAAGIALGESPVQYMKKRFIALGYSVIKIFFANIKRGGIMMTNIAVGSLYIFGFTRGIRTD